MPRHIAKTALPWTHVLASGQMAETQLKAGRNIVPAGLWKKETVQFTARGGESVQVFPPARQQRA